MERVSHHTGRYLLLLILAILMCRAIFAQPFEKKLSPADYINQYKDEAIKEMYLSGVPASITLAQGMLESGNGNSALAVYANNHFGIKCHKGWNGYSYYMDDDEKNECFRKYETVFESYSDHSDFLKSRDRYAFLFELPRTDYKAWAKGLKQAGYATASNYAEQLIELIERYKLFEFDSDSGMPVKSLSETTRQTAKLELRQVLRFNHTRFIIARNGDSFFKIASEFNLELEDLLKYNDLPKGEKLQAGSKLYVQRKRRKALEPFHVVTKGETMHSISQLHGIRLYWLYKRNRMAYGQEPKVGDVLYLRKRKPSDKG